MIRAFYRPEPLRLRVGRGRHGADLQRPSPGRAAAHALTIFASGSAPADVHLDMWRISSSSDPHALAVVDGLGKFRRFGAHYSRRTPGSKTFTGVGQEIVLLHESGRAVWACVRQRTPSARGSGGSRGRQGTPDAAPRFVWRNMLFRNLYAGTASDLIREATARTYEEWLKRYGTLPTERLRTEIGIGAVKSEEPGRCYRLAGWVDDRVVRGKLYMWAPDR